MNILAALIRDAGITEFKEPTITCAAFGPWWSDELDDITGHLKLI
jgi:peptidyl-tRNA hydrolase